MARHHLVPQMYLRRFADSRERLTVVSRADQRNLHQTSVERACAESGFYTIPAEDVHPAYRAGHDPERVEQTFSEIEGESAVYLSHIIDKHLFPPPAEERYRLTMFVALQATRGWAFRAEYEHAANLAMYQYIEVGATDESIEQFLRRRGSPARPGDVRAFRERLAGSARPRLLLPQTRAVQEQLRVAIEVIMPMIFTRRWELRVFNDPSLLTSDAPVAPWSPGVDGRFPAFGNALAVWWPIDRHHLLGFVDSEGHERIRDAHPARARQVNQLVAQQAERWIYHHPLDDPMKDLTIGPPIRPVDEIVDVQYSEDEVRELHRIVRRAHPPASAGAEPD